MNTTCSRCGRKISAPTALAIGMGRTCARRAKAEATYKPAQVEKATEIVELGAIARTTRKTSTGHVIYRVIASNGLDRYLTTVTACNCPAGRKGRRCYHRLATVKVA